MVSAHPICMSSEQTRGPVTPPCGEQTRAAAVTPPCGHQWCPICMSEEARGVVSPPCGHQLCLDCYNRIFHMAVAQNGSVLCPACRAILFETEDSDEDDDLEEFRISQNWWRTLARDYSEPHVSLQLTPINQFAVPLFEGFSGNASSRLLPLLCELGRTRRVILPGYTQSSDVARHGVSRFVISIMFYTRSDALAVAQALSDTCEFLLNWRDDGSHLVGLQASDGFSEIMPVYFSISQHNVPQTASRDRDLYHIIEGHNVRPTYLPHNWALLQLVAKFFPLCPNMPPRVVTYRQFELPQAMVGGDDGAIMRRIIDASPAFA